MPTPPLLDFEALLAPIPGAQPAGRSLPFEVRQKLDDARKDINPDDFSPDDPLRPADAQRADWPMIVRTTQQALTSTGKDLLVAARLTEALTKRHGFAGVRDGLGLLRRMITNCWDRILPVIEEEDDIEARGAAFFWLDDVDRGARFPSTLRMIPVVANEERGFGWLDWKGLQSAEKDDPARVALDKAVLATTGEASQIVVDDLEAAITELNTVNTALSERMGSVAPSLGGLQKALDDCLSLAQQIRAKKAGAAPGVGLAAASVEGGVAPGVAGVAMQVGPLASREQVYRQIATAADALRAMEPHSPIPYLLDRAVTLGDLSFPELMKVLVRDAQVLAAMNRELGIEGNATAPRIEPPEESVD
jgi:type VI secretion system protein ImpA